MSFINDEYDKFDQKMTEIEQKKKLEDEQKKAAEEAAKNVQKDGKSDNLF